MALNESALHDVRVRADHREAILLVTVLTLPEVGSEPEDRRRILRLTGVSEVEASLRLGHWEDADAPVELCSLDDLGPIVRSFNAQPIYGWEFFDPPAEARELWRNRLSLGVRLSEQPAPHVLGVFQESAGGPLRHLDLQLRFERLLAYDYTWTPVPLANLAADGRRWWDALHRGDPRTLGHGIVSGRLDE